MEKALRIDCNILRLALELYLSKDDIAKRLLAICKECPYKPMGAKPENCAGNPPTKLEDIYEPDEERR